MNQVVYGYGRQSAVMYYICVITLTININSLKLFKHFPNFFAYSPLKVNFKQPHRLRTNINPLSQAENKH